MVIVQRLPVTKFLIGCLYFVFSLRCPRICLRCLVSLRSTRSVNLEDLLFLLILHLDVLIPPQPFLLFCWLDLPEVFADQLNVFFVKLRRLFRSFPPSSLVFLLSFFLELLKLLSLDFFIVNDERSHLWQKVSFDQDLPLRSRKSLPPSTHHHLVHLLQTSDFGCAVPIEFIWLKSSDSLPWVRKTQASDLRQGGEFLRSKNSTYLVRH